MKRLSLLLPLLTLAGCFTIHVKVPSSSLVDLQVVEDKVVYHEGDTLLLHITMTNNDSVRVPLNFEYLTYRMFYNPGRGQSEEYLGPYETPFLSFDSDVCPTECMPITRSSEWRYGILKPADWKIKCPERCLTVLDPGERRNIAMRFFLLEPFSLYDTLHLVVESVQRNQYDKLPFCVFIYSKDTVTVIFDKGSAEL